MLRAAPKWIFPMHLDLSCKFLQTHLTFSIFRLSPWQALKVSLLWEAGLDRIPHMKEKKKIHQAGALATLSCVTVIKANSAKFWAANLGPSCGTRSSLTLALHEAHNEIVFLKHLTHLTYALVLEFQLAHWVRWPPGLLLNRSCLAISDSKWALWGNYGNAKLQNDSNSNRP